MDENVNNQFNKKCFLDLSESLSILVEDLRSYKNNITKNMKDKILSDLGKMAKLSKVLGGVIEGNFILLRNEIKVFMEDLNDFDEVMQKCVNLKNQLWEL